MAPLRRDDCEAVRSVVREVHRPLVERLRPLAVLRVLFDFVEQGRPEPPGNGEIVVPHTGVVGEAPYRDDFLRDMLSTSKVNLANY